MASISILPEYLANQIAAGEVVQRPESVVKEIVENALDAGASAVSVVVRGAGKQSIHVIDNGKGMGVDDLQLSVVRHATSKIITEADLHAIKTLGFRGEALASIAAVADVEIRSRQDSANENNDTGNCLTSRPGEPASLKPISTAVGTQIVVRNLFYNVPARRKFLKSDLTEFRHISETMQRMALSRPDVRFTFHDGDALVFDVKPSELDERIRDILAIQGADSLLPVSMDEGGVRVTGYVGTPSTVRQSRSGQFLYLNGRPIVSRALSHAVLTAYEHLLPHGSHPIFVLHLTADPTHVDVNVHPQKHEVKFDDERAVYLLVQAATTQALQAANVIPSYLAALPIAGQPLQSLPATSQGTHSFVNRFTGEIFQSNTRPSSQYHHQGNEHANPSVPTTLRSLFSPLVEVQPVLQVGAQYLLTASAEGVLVIDQHGAHERVLYEQILGKGAQVTRGEQALLFSVTVTLPPSDIAIVKEYIIEFQELGFRLDILNATSLEIHSVPVDVQAGNEEKVLGVLIESLRAAGPVPSSKRLQLMATTYAEKQAIRRGERLSNEEARELVAKLLNCSVPHLTPDGKPTTFLLPFDELASRLL